MQKLTKTTLSTFIILLGFSGCTPNNSAPRTDAAYGKKLFSERCAACHGVNGGGGGIASLGLGLKPPSLRNLSASNDGIFPRDYIMSKIDGYSRNGHSSEVMPEFGKGDLGPIVQVEEDGLSTPIPADLLSLANYIESLQD
jgi:mono/diheme cytochrome c family protein